MFASEPALRLATRALLASWVFAAHARSETAATDRALAEALFRDAKKLFAKKQYAEACRKLEESQRLDPQGGTLLNLAVCHAREGRTASAWVEFQEAIEVAKRVHRSDRVQLAEFELRQLEKKLSRLSIEVPKEARVPGLRLARGKDTLDASAWGTAAPVDPDMDLVISANADGYRPWSITLRVASGEQKTLVVPKLEKLPASDADTPEAAPPAPKPGPRRASDHTLTYVALGVGVVGVGVGSYFGLRAIAKKGEAEDLCTGNRCTEEGLARNDEAKRAATISNIGFLVGVVGIGAGTYLYLTSPSPDGAQKKWESARVRLSPSIGPRSSAILIDGRW